MEQIEKEGRLSQNEQQAGPVEVLSLLPTEQNREQQCYQAQFQRVEAEAWRILADVEPLEQGLIISQKKQVPVAVCPANDRKDRQRD